MKKFMVYKDICKGCELCVEFCPRDCIEMSDELNSQGYHPPRLIADERCTSCCICANMCPEVAIRIYRAPKGEKKSASEEEKEHK